MNENAKYIPTINTAPFTKLFYYKIRLDSYATLRYAMLATLSKLLCMSDDLIGN